MLNSNTTDASTREAAEAVPYMLRTRNYYRAMGYQKDFSWPSFDDTPLRPLAVPLADSRITIISTAGPKHWAVESQDQRSVWSADTQALPEAFFTEVAWDKESTHTRDVGSYLPHSALRDLVEAGVISALGERMHSVPTRYSERRTLQIDAPEILVRCRQDGADAALLTAL